MKKRIDILLVERGLADSRTKAQALLMSGQVFASGQRIDKAGTTIDEASDIEIKGKLPYVSRGALKIQKAYEDFQLCFKDKVICDIGASTGGFVDFAIQKGARKVYAIDVGWGQLDQKLRENPLVVVMERTNFRNIDSWQDFSKRVISGLRPEQALACPGSKNHDQNTDSGQARMTVDQVDYFLCDVSFISLKKIMPQIKKIADYKTECVLLIKPQFEVGKKEADKTKGVIKDENLRQEVVTGIKAFASEQGFKVKGMTESPITGAKGNKEFLIWLGK